MPAFLLALLPARFVKFALIAGTVLALMVVVAAMYRSHQRIVAEDAITLDRADISAEVSNKVIAADQAATANAIKRDAIADINDKELSHEADRADGNAVESVLERMRRQQAAGRR